MVEESKEPLDLKTRAVHAGNAANDSMAVSMPIYQSSTFRFRDAAHGAQISAEQAPTHLYTRWGNPTSRAVELSVASLENAEAALLFSSGMAAGSTSVLSLVKSGDHIVAGCGLYAGMIELFERVLPPLGVETSFVDPSDPENFRAALRDNSRLIYVETPANPTLVLTDLRAVAAIARERGLFTIADNTWASPVNQRPLDLGFDAVVHSATKYLGGHTDVVAGAAAGSRAWIARVWPMLKVLGGCPSPHDAYLLLRGIKTLPVRVREQNATALELARFLEQQSAVAKVHYPGLASHPQHALAKEQMLGFGGMLAFELKGGLAAGQRLLERLNLAIHAVSLGGIETLAVHPASTTHGPLTPEERQRAGVSDGLIRVSVGLEAASDLIEDFRQAL